MLKRAMTVLAGTAVFVTAIGVAASANETVKSVVKEVQDVADGTTVDTGVLDRVVGGDPGGDVIPDTAGPVRGTSPVVGYISITSNETVGLPPTYVVWGQLADPTEWACSGAGTAASYSVTCLPVPLLLPLSYKCDVLHADISTSSATSSGRTTLDCDSDGTGEAQTSTVSGVGHDSVWSLDGRAVSAFTCTIDNAAGNYYGGCGDPGTVDVTVG